MANKAILGLCAALLSVVLFEGLLSLATGRSIRELWTPSEPASVDPAFAEIGRDAARLTPGPFRVAENPRIAYTFKQEHEVEIFGKQVVTDALGLRRRPVPEPDGECIRVVVLGDSVAFGWGLDEEQVLAHQLEQVLAEVRGEQAVPAVARTVAIPSWNHANAPHFLFDHFDELDPDVVLYLPVDNDLNDSSTVLESGYRGDRYDPISPDPLLHVSRMDDYLRGLLPRIRARGGRLNPKLMGPDGFLAAASAESQRRLDSAASHIVAMATRMERNGGALYVLPYYPHEYFRQLRARLVRSGTAVSTLPLLGDYGPDDACEDRAHPSANTVRAYAIWCAEQLFADGVIDRGADRPLPDLLEAYRGRRATLLDDEAVLAWSAEFESEARAQTRNTIRDLTGEGTRQIYGGVRADGSMGIHFLAFLARGGGESLRVVLAPLEGRDDLYPLEVLVEVEGMTVGAMQILPASESPQTEQAFSLAAFADSPILEVKLRAERACTRAVGKRIEACSCRFVSLSCE